MKRKIRHSKELLRQFNLERKQYFEDARDENARLNLRMLKKSSMFFLVFLLLSFLIVPLVFSSWEMSAPYLGFVPVVLAFIIYSVVYSNKPDINIKIANASCVVFVIVIEILVMLVDVIANKSSHASYMPLILIIVPGLFVFPFSVLIPLLTGSEIIYIIALLQFETLEMAERDILTSVVGLVFGHMMAMTIVQLRIKDNNAKREYLRRSMVDPVTGILNKFSFENSAREALRAREKSTPAALLIMDIDNLKRMNDELGKLVGDMFLEDVAEYLTNIFRGSDIIGRVGGDEFMIYIRNMKQEDWLEKKCFRLQQEVKALSNEYGNVNITISIGVVIIKEKEVHFDEMYQIADNALYVAKTRGRGKCVIQQAE